MINPINGKLVPPPPGKPISDNILTEKVQSIRKFGGVVGRISRFTGYKNDQGVEIHLKDYIYQRPTFTSEVEFHKYLGSILP